MNKDKFHKIRPYFDSEVNEAVKKILENTVFSNFISKYLFDGKIEDYFSQISQISSVREFQEEISSKYINKMSVLSIKKLNVQGLDNVKKSKPYLFISTHRDIALDSALLQIALYHNGYNTTRSAIGNNLVPNDLLLDIAKLNKMFLVIRDGSVRELPKNSFLLSEYIRNSITNDKESVWIAQRNGRTKDGNDQTQKGLLKMLATSYNGILIEGLKELNIVPISISYEYETCDAMKASETVISLNGTYKKQPGEDMKSIETGILQYKGNVEINICKPINDKLDKISSELTENDKLKYLASLIDSEIYNSYKLWGNNYIAADILSNKNNFESKYTTEEKIKFEQYINEKVELTDLDKNCFKENLLKIYANPVYNKNQL